MKTTAKTIKKTKVPKALKQQILLAKISSILWKIVRGTIVIGICFVILYPLFVKFSVSIMEENDLYDSTFPVTASAIPKKSKKRNFMNIGSINT